MKNITHLIIKNILVYILSYLATFLIDWLYGSLVYDLLPYPETFNLILSLKGYIFSWIPFQEGFSISAEMLLTGITIVLFNVLFFRLPHVFKSKARLILLGGFLNLLIFVLLVASSYYMMWLWEFLFLSMLSGCVFGFFYYHLVSKKQIKKNTASIA